MVEPITAKTPSIGEAARLIEDERGRLRHLLSLEGLREPHLRVILERAALYRQAAARNRTKVDDLAGRTVVNLFFEPSTRTRTTFELAARRLSAEVINFPVESSATRKGESLLDTLKTLSAMRSDLFVIRHQDSGAAHFFARHAPEEISIINAGDGRHAHPTQGLLDSFTLLRHRPELDDLCVVIVGDVLHSRVARSQMQALQALRVGELRICAPATLLPPAAESLGAQVFTELDDALAGADVVIALRLQRERMQGPYLPSEGEYFRRYGITAVRLARANADCLVMHPGPMQRGVEISSDVADGPRSLIDEQVTNGIFVRMAVMAVLLERSLSLR